MPKFAGSTGLLFPVCTNGFELRVALIRLDLSCASIDTLRILQCSRRRTFDVRRQTIGVEASAIAATVSSVSIALAHFAPAAEKPMPVAAVNHAARHNGHLGSNTNAAPGRIEAAALESRRARRLDVAPPTQHCPVIRQLLRSTRKTGAVSSAPPEELVSSFIVWRLASAPFALPRANSIRRFRAASHTRL